MTHFAPQYAFVPRGYYPLHINIRIAIHPNHVLCSVYTNHIGIVVRSSLNLELRVL